MATQTGIFRGMSFADYRAIRAVNISRLRKGRRTNAHLHAAFLADDEDDSAAKTLGRAAHMALLEPSLYAEQVLTAECINPGTGKCYGRDTKKWAEYEAANAGRLIVTAEEREAIVAITTAVSRHTSARRILMASGSCEAVLVWKDAQTGIYCKGRLDKFIEDQLAADLKTTADASWEAFSKSIAKFGYHNQIPWYIDGIEALTGSAMDIPLVALETDPPHGVAVYRLEDAAVEQGRNENRVLLLRLAECMESGKWDGYPAEVQTIGLPKWAQTQLAAVGDDDFNL